MKICFKYIHLKPVSLKINTLSCLLVVNSEFPHKPIRTVSYNARDH